MRILILNYEYPPLGGGAGNATKYLLKEYAKMPDMEIVLVTSSVDTLHDEKESPNIRVVRLPIGKSKEWHYQSYREILSYAWKSWKFSEKLFRRKRFDCVHAFFGVPCGEVARRLSRTFGVPYVVSLRGSDVPGYSERFTILYRVLTPVITRVWRGAGVVVANSEGLRELALRSSPRQEISIIPNGVDTDVFAPRAEENNPARPFTILCASRLSRRKGFRFVVEALVIVRREFPDARLILAGGEGNAEGELRGLVSRLGLENAVEFTGRYDHAVLNDLQHRADVFALPSFNEGMSNNLLEALAGGLPVIVTDTGGSRELVKDGENGFFVPAGDARAIAEKILVLGRDKELRRRIGRASRARAEKMSWRAVAEAYTGVYSEALTRNKS